MSSLWDVVLGLHLGSEPWAFWEDEATGSPGRIQDTVVRFLQK